MVLYILLNLDCEAILANYTVWCSMHSQAAFYIGTSAECLKIK